MPEYEWNDVTSKDQEIANKKAQAKKAREERE